MKKNKKLIWVSPEFDEKLRINSAQSGMSKLDFTKELAKSEIPVFDKKTKKAGRKKRSIWEYEVHILPPQK